MASLAQPATIRGGIHKSLIVNHESACEELEMNISKNCDEVFSDIDYC